MNPRAAALLLFAMSFLASPLPRSWAAEHPITRCRLSSQNNQIVVGDEKMLARQPWRKRDVLAVLLAKGLIPFARVSCTMSPTQARKPLGIPRDAYPSWEMSIDGARVVRPSNPRSRMLTHFLPLRHGQNEFTVKYRHKGYRNEKKNIYLPPGEISRSFRFTAWVFRMEPWGRLRNPFPASKGLPRFYPQLMDAAGNLYMGVADLKGKGAEVLLKYSPDGRIASRVEIAPPGGAAGKHLFGARGVRVLGADAKGGIYASLRYHIVRFGPKGKFDRSIAVFGKRRAAESLADLYADPRFSQATGPFAAVNYIWPPPASPIPFFQGGFYLPANLLRPPTRGGWSLVRIGLDGRFENLGLQSLPGEKFTALTSLTAGPDGRLYALLKGKRDYVIRVLDQKGKKLRELREPKAPSQWIREIRGHDSRDGVYSEGACRRVSLRDWKVGEFSHARVTQHTFPEHPVLHYYDALADVHLGDVLIRPRRSREAMDAIHLAGRTLTCWVHSGSVYVLYGDMQVGRIRFSGAGKTRPTAVVSKPAKFLRLSLERVGASFDDGVLLDGKTPVEVRAKLTDQGGKALSGIRVEFRVLDDRLPRSGKFSLTSPAVTDAEGRVSGQYLPPTNDPKEIRKGSVPVVTLGAHVHTKELGEASDQKHMMPLFPSAAMVRLEREGLLPPPPFPVQVGSLRAGTLKGVVTFRPPSGAGAAAEGEILRYSGPVAGVKVELVDRPGKKGKVIGQALTAPDGSFTLEYQPDPRAKIRPETVLEEELSFQRFRPEVVERARRLRSLLQVMNSKKYGYRIGTLEATLLKGFPRRLASAAGPDQAVRVIEQLERISLLSAAIRVTHDLESHAAEAWADSLSEVMNGLLGLLDPLEKLNKKGDTGGTVRYGLKEGFEKLVGQDAPAGDVLKLTTFSKLRHLVLSKIKAKLADPAMDDQAWKFTKSLLQKFLLQPAVGASAWKGWVSRGLLVEFRQRGQGILDRAARAWRRDRIPHGGAVGLMFRDGYSRLAENRRRVTNRQLSKELSKANVDLAFATIGQGAVIISGLYGSPAAAEKVKKGVEMLQKGVDVLNTAMDAYLGYKWLQDYMSGYQMLRQYATAALETGRVCLGTGC